MASAFARHNRVQRPTLNLSSYINPDGTVRGTAAYATYIGAQVYRNIQTVDAIIAKVPGLTRNAVYACVMYWLDATGF